MNSNRNIIFVYNAKGGKWNYILDTVHKYASPSTYECNLCKITHDLKINSQLLLLSNININLAYLTPLIC